MINCLMTKEETSPCHRPSGLVGSIGRLEQTWRVFRDWGMNYSHNPCMLSFDRHVILRHRADVRAGPVGRLESGCVQAHLR